jgi:hypothetical protein
MLAFVEHLFGVPAMGDQDASAYDFANSFSFTTPSGANAQIRAARTPRMVTRHIPAWERRYLKQHPAPPDDT